MDAVDADVLIYAASGDERGTTVLAALESGAELVGSVLLLPELLSHPIRHDNPGERSRLEAVLARITLWDVTMETADVATQFRARYGLRTADAIHLATAVLAGADRFHTNNHKDFPATIAEIEIAYA